MKDAFFSNIKQMLFFVGLTKFIDHKTNRHCLHDKAEPVSAEYRNKKSANAETMFRLALYNLHARKNV